MSEVLQSRVLNILFTFEKAIPGDQRASSNTHSFWKLIKARRIGWIHWQGFKSLKALSSDLFQFLMPCNPEASQTGFASSTEIIAWEDSSLALLPSQICSGINPVLPVPAACASPVFLIALWFLNILALPHTELSAVHVTHRLPPWRIKTLLVF